MTDLSATLPFEEHALEPHVSRPAVAAHFRGYHQRPAERLSAEIRNTEYEGLPLEKLIANPVPRTLRTLATQVWNHAFLWRTLAPPEDRPLPPQILELLVDRFGGLEPFQQEFLTRARKIVGSGWLWLVLDPSGNATMLLLSNTTNPLAFGYEPLLGCDLWEHAYFLDHRHDRDAYLEAWWRVVNWDYVNDRLRRCRRGDLPLPLN